MRFCQVLPVTFANIDTTFLFLMSSPEHVKIVQEQIETFGEQCKLAEKEKKDAFVRLEVLTNFFNEKEAQRQK